ncbi:MAG: dihydropteroate synthase [Verrucomicrobia bacterium]|nr:dihydropteroate synthase [Verrucomicrobiota bacterium]
MLDLRDLAELVTRHGDGLDAAPAPFALSGHSFRHHPHPDLMGVVNLSRDSWYRESVSLSTETAIRRGRRLLADGATVIDIGAESTLSHAARVDEKGQRAALLPVISALSGAGAIISAETYEPKVAEACLDAGAGILNLTSGTNTEDFYRLVAEREAGVIICYLQGRHVRDVADFSLSEDHVGTLEDYFRRETDLASHLGVKRIWIDPGLGFYYRNLTDSKERIRYQMRTFLHAFRLRKLGWPICQALPHAFEFFEEEVRSAEPFFAVLAALGRTDLIRTHEVNRVRAVLRTLQAYE